MTVSNYKSNGNNKTLQNSVVQIINAKIQKADQRLKNFMNALKVQNQSPGRAHLSDNVWINKQKNVFDIIENSSLYTTKLLYLRANLTEYNSRKILFMLSTSQLENMALQELKKEIS